MHLHFASTPSRSNAAVRELARLFRGQSPDWTISSSGFHSFLHLLPRLGLGSKYRACFFGDNFPIPRPNALYQQICESSPDAIEIWSLLSYVESLRAGALGQSYAVTKSLIGTDMARDLARSGNFREVDVGEESENIPPLGLVRAVRPDITFVHALLGDEHGNLVCSQPSSEGFWGAIGAKVGVIATVERIGSTEELREFRDAMPIPRHQVLSISEEPRGAHPQPVYASPRFPVEGYEDDLAHYQVWRRLATDDAFFKEFCSLVLDVPDGRVGYQNFCNWVANLEGFKTSFETKREFPKGAEILIILAARKIRERVREGGYQVIIAGIGNSFFAARLAKQWLDEEGVSIDVIVETGLVGIECGQRGHPFLLSHQNMGRAERISNAEHALGALTCGADNVCLGVVGAGEVDQLGNLNSTFLKTGKLLVGSGGANDIASSAAEVIVLTRCTSARLVDKVHYITSSGARVRTVVTDICSFTRQTPQSGWFLDDVYPALGGNPIQHALAHIKSQCSWPYETLDRMQFAAPVSTKEMRGFHTLDPTGEHWTRENSS
tara:strand:- start:11923 stop:13575 length:1653 start_codon:yes stop_codon:yes gene_type:complete